MTRLEHELRRLGTAPPIAPESLGALQTRAAKRRSRRRMVAGFVAVTVLAGGVGLVVLTREERSPSVVAQSGSRGATRPGRLEDRYVPPTIRQGDTVVLPVTVPDGRRFELRYPRGLEIAQRGYMTQVGVRTPFAESSNCCDLAATISYTTIADAYGSVEPAASYVGVNGTKVQYYAPRPSQRSSSINEPGVLVFQFGPWMVRVWSTQFDGITDRMTEPERAVLAANLDAHTDKRGYLVLEPRQPLKLGARAKIEFAFGNMGSGFGPGADSLNKVAIGATWLCGTTDSDTAKPRRLHPDDGVAAAAAWCDPNSGLHINVEGTKRFVDVAIRSLQVRKLSRAPKPPTSTTTPPDNGASVQLPAKWVIARGNEGNTYIDPNTGAIPGCPWLTDPDLQAVWDLLTQSRTLSDYTLSAAWDPEQRVGHCQVGGFGAQGRPLLITIAVASRDATKSAKRAAAARGELYPTVKTDVITPAQGPGAALKQSIVLAPTSRVIVSLVWYGGAVRVSDDRFRQAINTTAARLAFESS